MVLHIGLDMEFIDMHSTWPRALHLVLLFKIALQLKIHIPIYSYKQDREDPIYR